MKRIRSKFVFMVFLLFLTIALAPPAVNAADMEDVHNSIIGTLQAEMLPPNQEPDPEPEPSQLSPEPEEMQPAGSMSSVTVTNNADSGPGSLRQAIVDIAAGGTITFDGIMYDQTITLTSGSLNIDKSMTIDAGGVPNVTISGNGVYRVFNVTNGSFFLRNLTIINGMAPPSQAGGGILTSSPASVTVENCTFTGNTSAASGGGICSLGLLTVSNSTFSNNLGGTYGGGIIANGPLTALNCTFTGNTSAYGSGVHAENTSYFLNCTFVANANGAALSNMTGNMSLYNCIVWNNPFPGVITTGVLSVNSSDVQGYVGGVGNIDQNPLLGPLGNYGGNVQTMPLLPGSPCLNRCVANFPIEDARGVNRGSTADMGAFESRGFDLSIVSGTPQSTVINTSFPVALTVRVSSPFSDPVSGAQVEFTPPGSGASATITGSPATIQADGTASVTAVANAVAGGPYNVAASVTGLNTGIFTLTNLPIMADLAVTKTHTGSIIAGENLSYTITVTNNGPSAVANVSFTDPLPTGTAFVSLSTLSGPACTASVLDGTVSGSITSLASGSTSVLNLTVHINEGVADGSVITNTATVSSATADPDPGNNSASDSGTVIPSGTPGVTVNPTSLSSTEGGAEQTFTVSLNNRPTANVIIAVSSSDASEITSDTSTLTFMPSNWATPQMVTVTPVFDGLLDGVQTASVQLGVAAGSAAEYLSIDPSDVTVTVQDRFSAAPVLTAHPGSRRVSLTWTPVAEAASYSVYTSTTPGSFSETPVSVSAAVNEYEAAGLINNRTYYFMVQAVDAQDYTVDSNTVRAVPYHEGGGSGGKTTIPNVATHGAVSVEASSAVLQGSITGGNLSTQEYGFYYGSNSGSLSQHKTVGTGDYRGDFSYELKGLDPDQSCYFQAYAITSNGQTVYGQIMHFTTAPKAEPVSQPDEQLPPGQNFSDVPDSYWARAAILEMSAKGYISGYKDGTFRPDEKISRAEFVTILVRSLHLQAGTNGRVFSDTSNHWAKDSIATAAGLNICAGYADGSFKPDALISREEMAVMVIKAAAMEQASGETNFADNSRISGWAKGSILAVVNQHIMNGYPDNTFRPKANASRAEAVVVIKALLK